MKFLKPIFLIFGSLVLVIAFQNCGAGLERAQNAASGSEPEDTATDGLGFDLPVEVDGDLGAAAREFTISAVGDNLVMSWKAVGMIESFNIYINTIYVASRTFDATPEIDQTRSTILPASEITGRIGNASADFSIHLVNVIASNTFSMPSQTVLIANPTFIEDIDFATILPGVDLSLLQNADGSFKEDLFHNINGGRTVRLFSSGKWCRFNNQTASEGTPVPDATFAPFFNALNSDLPGIDRVNFQGGLCNEPI